MKSNATVLGFVLFALAFALHSLAIKPTSDSLVRARKELADESARLAAVQIDIASQDGIQGRIARLEEKTRHQRETWLTPMLNSYAMRVKSILDTAATESGLTHVEYTEGTLRTLPLPKAQVPKNRTARRSVRITALADYAATVSFLERAEAMLPYMSLQSFNMTPQHDTPTVQNVEMVLEWPAEGEVIK